MNQLGKQQYQVAWFKLSEFIRRGEKERALGIYKLLMHTVDDQAFAKQLEGDLLLFFNDAGAFQSYISAAQLYKKHNKLSQATAVYEHLVAQFPYKKDFLQELINCYLELNHPTRIVVSLERLFIPLVQAQPIGILVKALEDVNIILEKSDQAHLCCALILTSIAYKKDEPAIIQPLIDMIIPWLDKQECEQLRQHLSKEYTINKH